MLRPPPRPPRTYTLFPYTTLLRSFLQFIGIVDDNRVYAQALKRVAHGPEVGAAGIDHRHPLRRPAHSTPLVLGSPPPSRRIASPSARATSLQQASTWWWSFSPCTRSEEHTSELLSLMRTSHT